MLTVVMLETLHCSKPPDRKHPKGSDKVYAVAVTRQVGSDRSAPHFLDVLFGPRLGTKQFRRWGYPTYYAARIAFEAKVAEQVNPREGYVKIDWTQAFYGLQASVQALGEFALAQRPAATAAPSRLPRANNILVHEWRPVRKANRPQDIVCAAGCGRGRNDTVHAVQAADPDEEPEQAPQRAPRTRPQARTERVLPPTPPPQPLRPPQRERRGRNINIPR